ncbi:zinc finger protein 135-like isoform X2 [Gouania willdenowi]|uniref:zinc finger protein 135-like isoform X2 n=1 Tax=Gouania willdenowi TaxID=441366 RepID=UPI001054A5DA|nr:zinc finger protein 135-like isoform X2 [Gouania willdenowi]
MDSFTEACLPLASLRLLVPPVQLMAASMWQVVKKKEVMSFWKVANFVSLVVDMVPELVMHKYSTQLKLGLRARFILELCKNEPVITKDLISSYLDTIKSSDLEGEEEEGVLKFTELVHTLLKDSDTRQDFFSEVLPADFGAQYDNDVQTLFWEFLYRLTQLLPVPDLQKTVSWLGSKCSLLNNCGYSVTELADLKILLQHHKNLGHLEQHVPPSNMGENILSSLSAFPTSSVVKSHIWDPLQAVHEDMQTVFVDDVAVEVITVTDYTEVELSSTTHVEDGENSCSEGTCINAAAEGSTKRAKEEEAGDGLKETLETIGSRHTHEAAHKYDCVRQCCKKFNVEVRLKAHTDQSAVNTGEEEPDFSSPVKVRTSGRVRRPTMKIQVNNKCMTAKRRMETSTVTAPLKPGLQSAEHSYGTSNDGDAGAPSVSHCPQCAFQHPEEAEMQLHMESVHSSDTAGETSTLRDQSGRFSCSVCEKSFKFQCLLKAHERIHTGEQPFVCGQCGRHFSFKQSLERHKRTHRTGRRYECGIPENKLKSVTAEKVHQSTRMENREYQCTECGRAFVWKSALLRHMKSHAVVPEQGEESNRHPQTHQEEKVHTCNCGKSFSHRSALAAHQRIHWKERPHTCTQCGKGFLHKGRLLCHMKTHSEEKPFMCSFCGKSFKRERSMKTHEHYHTRENVFSCSQCDKSFVYKATLIRHELTHSGERPYLCSDCGKGFFSHAELLKHERFHTGHKPFQCPHCEKRFTQSCYLTVHLRYHTGVRPYSCAQCDKSFLSANRLKRHQRIHSGERPYLCVECGKQFRQSYNLKMHQRTHTMKLTENPAL